MTTFLIALHIMVCLVLIGVVLLQRGKGAEMGAAFGGGGASPGARREMAPWPPDGPSRGTPPTSSR